MPNLNSAFQSITKSLILFVVVFASCKEEEPVDLRITTLTKEEVAIQAEVARNSVTPILVEGLKMEVWEQILW